MKRKFRKRYSASGDIEIDLDLVHLTRAPNNELALVGYHVFCDITIDFDSASYLARKQPSFDFPEDVKMNLILFGEANATVF